MISFSLFIAALLAAPADPVVSARGELDAAEIPFHHVAHYRVTVEGPAETEIGVEPWAEALPGLTVKTGEPEVVLLPGGRKQYIQELTLTPSVVMNYTLPATRVTADGAEVTTVEPMELTVRALTPEERAEASVAADLVSLAELEQSTPGWWRAVAVPCALGLAVLILLWVLVAKALFRPGTRGPQSPVEVIEAGLGALERQLQAGELSCDVFFVALSGLLRTYLCTSFDPTVSGQSTPEFLASTLATLPLPEAHSGTVRDLLREFDRVKFGQFTPARDAQLRDLEAVRQVVAALETEAGIRAARVVGGAA
jgi:hypothetical protein